CARHGTFRGHTKTLHLGKVRSKEPICGKIRPIALKKGKMKVLDPATGNLLRAVVQPPAAVRAIADLASKITSWEAAIEGARQHGILPMLLKELVSVEGAIPSSALDLIRNEFERNAFHCSANTLELLEVLQLFEAAGIPAMPFKGVVLGASVY